jgi:hypothetical protein
MTEKKMKSVMVVVPRPQVRRGGDAHRPPQAPRQTSRQVVEEVQVLRLLTLPTLPSRQRHSPSHPHNIKVNPNNNPRKYLLEALRHLQINNINRSLLVLNTRVVPMDITRPIIMAVRKILGCTEAI